MQHHIDDLMTPCGEGPTWAADRLECAMLAPEVCAGSVIRGFSARRDEPLSGGTVRGCDGGGVEMVHMDKLGCRPSCWAGSGQHTECCAQERMARNAPHSGDMEISRWRRAAGGYARACSVLPKGA